MEGLARLLERGYLAYLIVGGIVWVIDIPQYLGVSLIAAEWLGPYLGIAVAAAYLKTPYGPRAGLLDIGLGWAGIAAWTWMAANVNDWMIDFAGYTPQKFVPGMIAILVMMEAIRKACGLPITLLTWALIAYGFFGYLMPGPFAAEQLPIPRYVMYIYADTNGVPGLVLNIITTLVLTFILLGKLMEVSGATQFFNDLALAAMGHRRGGPAKVAVIASSAFGTISGSTVGNIMSTGIVTIPLMKRTGFNPNFAAAIEAVASNGGQIAPPVMGTVAFLIAEFLEITYTDVVVAAAVPAVLYYLCLFLQVDSIAAQHGLKGIPREELPRATGVIKDGWIFVVPLVVLIYLLFWLAFTPALSAMAATFVLFVLMLLRNRRLPSKGEWADLVFGSGENMLPLILIGGAAGVVIGVMNVTGLGQSLSFVLNQVGQNAGLLVMLLLTAGISIILGMGMPSAAVYVILSIILAPAIVRMGVTPMGAHMFIFYFGILSFLTPPVAVASYVAAGLAGSNMWRTGMVGMQLAAVAYLLPFLWAFNPALLLEGPVMASVLVILSAVAGVLLIVRAIQGFGNGSLRGWLGGLVLFAIALAVGSSTIWLGPESLENLASIAVGAVLYYLTAHNRRKPA